MGGCASACGALTLTREARPRFPMHSREEARLAIRFYIYGKQKTDYVKSFFRTKMVSKSVMCSDCSLPDKFGKSSPWFNQKKKTL